MLLRRAKAKRPDHGVHIRSSTGWTSLGLRDVWEYRELLYYLLTREIRGQYRQMAFGPLWIIIQPLMSMVLFSFIFGRLARLPSDGVPYPIFTYVALLPWQFFNGALRGASGSLVSQKAIIAKVYFPRLIIPLNAVLSSLVNFSFSFVVLVAMMAFYAAQGDITVGWQVVTLPAFLALGGMLAMGVGCWLAGLAVKYRDVGFVTGYFMTAWQYLTPVAYASSNVADSQFFWLYKLNPMYSVIENIRWALIGRGAPPDGYTLYSFIFAVVVLLTGIAFFRRSERTIVDLL